MGEQKMCVFNKLFNNSAKGLFNSYKEEQKEEELIPNAEAECESGKPDEVNECEIEKAEEVYKCEGEENGEEYEVVEREILPAKIICPDCGGITLEGLDFCDKCGGELH
jgi:hypothetical protein